MSNSNTDVHMFWAYGNISKLERICISSFIYNAYNVNLWTYGKITNAPPNISVRDANEILPEKRVFLSSGGSYAPFADLFRYSVLNKVGGLYSDTDVIATSPFPPSQNKPFLVTQRDQEDQNKTLINNNVIFNPEPNRGNIIDLAEAVADRFPPEKISWSEIGPKLLTSLVFLQPRHYYEIKEPNFANPINFWDCPKALLAPDVQLPPGVCFLHCYNQMWRVANIDMNALYPPGSLMGYYEKTFLKS